MNTATNTTVTPSIYVSNGRDGRWITIESDTILTDIIAETGFTVFTIADHEGFGGIRADMLSVQDLARLVEYADDHAAEMEIVAAAMDYTGNNVDAALEALENGFSVYDNDAAWGEEIIEFAVENGDVSETFARYMDAEAIGRDERMSHTTTSMRGDRFIVWH